MKSLKVFVLSPSLNDASVACEVLREHGLNAIEARDSRELCSGISDNCGALILTDEALTPEVLIEIEEELAKQETWSDLPVLLLTTNERARLEEKFSREFNVSLLERPFSRQTLVRAVEAALRARKKQFQIRTLLEELSTSKDEADRANQTKSQFLANMSHEIRTPIGAIMGFSELIKQPDLSFEERSRYMEIINRNSHQLLHLIDDILDLSKVEAGKLAIEQHEFGLPDLLADLTSIMKLRASEKGVKFHISLATKIPDRVVSDPTRLRQILSNIIGNAIKFTGSGSVQLVAGCDEQKQKLIFSVIDTGVGLRPDQVKNLFQPFVQADASTTRKFGGSGLGLVISRQLARALGGDVVLAKTSEAGGSEFHIDLNFEKAPGAKMVGEDALTVSHVSSTLASATTLQDLRVLLVEDSPDNQMLITRYLTKAGCKIETAADGAEGIARVEDEDFDVVLMDIQMPVMDGHEATRILRAHGIVVPIIALTAHAMKEEKEKGRQSGFTDFLTKPIQPRQLIEVLETYRPVKAKRRELGFN